MNSNSFLFDDWVIELLAKRRL